MFQGKYVFSQITEFIPRREFYQFVKLHKGNQRVRHLDCRDQFLAMIFGQLRQLAKPARNRPVFERSCKSVVPLGI